MATEHGQHESRRLTCVLARPGRYELIWHGTPPIPSAASAINIPVSRPVYRDIVEQLSSREPEVGGLLLGPRNSRLVTHFVLDDSGVATPTSFAWDHVRLNGVVRRYLDCGIDIKGMAHSHPAGCPDPTEQDRKYLRRLLSCPKNTTNEFYFPILCGGHLKPFVVTPASLGHATRWAVAARIVLI